MDCLSFIKTLNCTSESVIVFIQVYNILIGILNVLGNAALIWALRKTQQTKSLSFQFILIMSTSDIIIGINGLVFLTLVSIEPYQSNCWLKFTVQFTLNACNYFSIFMIFLIALDRYLHMKLLERYLVIVTKKKGYMLIGFLLILAIVSSAMFILPMSKLTMSVLQMVFFAVSIVFLASIIFLYHKSLCILRKKASQISRSTITQSRALGRAGKSISICVLCLILPIVVVLMLEGVDAHLNLFNTSVLAPVVWLAFITLLGNGFCSSVIFMSQNIPIKRALRRALRHNWNQIQSAFGTNEDNT